MKWLLLDGYNLAFRAFYAIRELSRSDGFPTNAIHGWLRTIWKLLDDQNPCRMVAFFDLGGPQRQLAIYPEYKANRQETPESFKEQIPWIKKLTQAMGIPIVEQNGIEADDLLASFIEQIPSPGDKTLIVSADKDLAQCIHNNTQQLLPPPTANPRLGWRYLDEQGVQDKFGIPPAKIPSYLALIGDTSDNIPGIPGVGPKTASKWLSHYDSLEDICNHANTIKPPRFSNIINEMKPELKRNLELVTLKANFPISLNLDATPQLDQLVEYLEALEMPASVQEARKRFSS